MTVDFSATVYPPIPHKLGTNTTWDDVGPAELAEVQLAIDAGLGTFSGLVETNIDGGTSVFPLFWVDGGVVSATMSAGLRAARAPLAGTGLVNFVQFAGTPPPFPVDSSATRPKGGNWYALPPADAGLDLPMAQAFGDLVSSALPDGVPTIWAFWQEPDHTLDGRFDAGTSLARYVQFYAQASLQVRARGPDVMVAGVQQNAAAGISPKGALDGAQYLFFSRDLLAAEADAGRRFPFDFVTIQNYQGESSDQVMKNARLAYAAERFNTAPVLMNEFDFEKDAGFSGKYDSADGGLELLDIVADLLVAPDVDTVLVKQRIFNQASLSSHALGFLNSMPEFQRPVTLTGARAGAVRALATGDARSGQALVVLNPGAEALSVRLTGAGTAPFTVSRLDGSVVAQGPLPLDVTVGGTDALLARAGASTGSPLPGYARHMVWCDRVGDTSPPLGMGHVDPRRSSLLVGAAASSNAVGLAGVVLRSAPDALAVGLESAVPLAAGVASVRLDFLDGETTTKTVVLRDGAGPTWPTLDGWRSTGFVTEQVVDWATTQHLSLTALAPPGWTVERRVQVSLLLLGTSAGPQAVRATVQ